MLLPFELSFFLAEVRHAPEHQQWCSGQAHQQADLSTHDRAKSHPSYCTKIWIRLLDNDNDRHVSKLLPGPSQSIERHESTGLGNLHKSRDGDSDIAGAKMVLVVNTPSMAQRPVKSSQVLAAGVDANGEAHQ